MSYIIGTGWWCDGTGRHLKSKANRSSDKTRQVDFFSLWYQHVASYTNADAVVVVDSKSPQKPDFNDFDSINVIEMLKNFPPSLNNCTNIFGTPTTMAARQMYIGAFFALLNGVDYYVWIEQDCLVHGERIVELSIESMGDANLSMGFWNHEYHMETSFIIMRTSAVPSIFAKYIEAVDNRPEKKYWRMISEGVVSFAPLPFGFGRNRPINFDDSHYFAQHLNDTEISKFKEFLGK